VQTAITSGKASTVAMRDSTEHEQFESTQRRRVAEQA